MRLHVALQPPIEQGKAEPVWLAGQTWRHLLGDMRGGLRHIFHFIGSLRHGLYPAQGAIDELRIR